MTKWDLRTGELENNRKGHENSGKEYSSEKDTVQESEDNSEACTRIVSYKAR